MYRYIWTTKRSNQSIQKKSTLNYLLSKDADFNTLLP